MVLEADSGFRVLLVPGLHGSGEEHWQTRWERRYPAFCRVEQKHWDRPDLAVWSDTMRQALQQSTQPTLAVAHSFGCLTTLHCARLDVPNLVGALLVAPADPVKFGVSDLLRAARPAFPSMLVGSLNDPWMTADRARHWAHLWGCSFVNAGALGHINAESNLGEWPFGMRLLRRLALRHIQKHSKDMQKSSFSL